MIISHKSTYKLLAGIVALVMITSVISPAYATLDLIPSGVHSGNVAVSSDGCGANSICTILHDVPPGSTILQANMYATHIGTFGPILPSVTVDLDDNLASGVQSYIMSSLPQNTNPIFASYRADVTAQVAASIAAGATSFTVDDSGGGTQPSSVVDGVSLVIIYSNPALPLGSVIVKDGGLNNIDSTTIFFAGPITIPDPSISAEMRLAISFGQQGGPAGSDICGNSGVFPMFTLIDINTIRLTSCAGNLDDGLVLTNGALYTIGGVGDPIAPNPTLPLQVPGDGTQPRTDQDERYDVKPFILNGDTQMVVDVNNPSNDDFTHILIFYITGTTADIEPIDVIGGEIIPINTMALLIAGINASAFSLMGAFVFVGIASFVALFYTVKRKN